jgi:hypothetical protein
MNPQQRQEIISALNVDFGAYEALELAHSLNELFDDHGRLTRELAEATSAVKFWREKHDELAESCTELNDMVRRAHDRWESEMVRSGGLLIENGQLRKERDDLQAIIARYRERHPEQEPLADRVDKE